jgi:hypothetical protein
MTDTQYRVLGDLVAGGSIERGDRGERPYMLSTPGSVARRYAVPTPTVLGLLNRGWTSGPLGVRWLPHRITDAGRAAYAQAQAQAQRAAQEATG